MPDKLNTVEDDALYLQKLHVLDPERTQKAVPQRAWTTARSQPPYAVIDPDGDVVALTLYPGLASTLCRRLMQRAVHKNLASNYTTRSVPQHTRVGYKVPAC